MGKQVKTVMILSLVSLFVILNFVFPYETLVHEILVHSFFIVIVIIAFLNARLLVPAVIFYILVHSLQDAYSFGKIPDSTYVQSVIHLFFAIVLYRVITLRNKMFNDKARLIEKMALGHAHFSRQFSKDSSSEHLVLLSHNTMFMRMLGLNDADLENKSLSMIFNAYSKDWTQYAQDVLSNGESKEFSSHIPHMDKYFRLSFYAPQENEGAVLIQDITKYKKATKRIEYMNRHDRLTGLYNREYLTAVLRSYVNENVLPLGALLFDINNLKLLNTIQGLSLGDKAIQMAAEILNKHATPEMVLFRYGGDEFAILVPKTTEEVLASFAKKVELDFASRSVDQFSMAMTSGYVVKNDVNEDPAAIMNDVEAVVAHHKTVNMDSSQIYLLKGLLELLTAKFNYEKMHSEKVSDLSRKLGKKLGLSTMEIEELSVAAMFHDIGKIAIPDAILGKPAKLNDEEYETMKTHAFLGHKILKAADPYTNISTYVLHHHERYDGKGYPHKLSEDAIPLQSRILAVCDAFEAMTSKRNYHNPESYSYALREIQQYSGTQFDPEISKVFIAMIKAQMKGATS